jgi:hypothetical protein
MAAVLSVLRARGCLHRRRNEDFSTHTQTLNPAFGRGFFFCCGNISIPALGNGATSANFATIRFKGDGDPEDQQSHALDGVGDGQGAPCRLTSRVFYGSFQYQ